MTQVWKKEPAIEGGSGGCLHCGFQHEILPMTGVITVGFGAAGLSKNGLEVWSEGNKEFDDCLSVEEAEKIAATEPDNDWRIYYFAPLSEREYQRQGDKHWVLIKKGMGFA